MSDPITSILFVVISFLGGGYSPSSGIRGGGTRNALVGSGGGGCCGGRVRVGLEVGVGDVAAVAVPILDVPPLARSHLEGVRDDSVHFS